jgi:ferredoxin-NADP reductase
MSTPKTANVSRIVRFVDHSVMIDLEMAGEETLGFTGGQYVIIDSGKQLADGRAAKRAYSMLSSDASQNRLTLAARRIGEGLASNHLMGLNVGDKVTFSGPWGRLMSGLDSSEGDTEVREPRATVVAFGTGITAALGLVNGVKLSFVYPSVTLIWVDYGDAPFLSPECVIESIKPQGQGTVRYQRIVANSQEHADASSVMAACRTEDFRYIGAGGVETDSGVVAKRAALWATHVASHMVFLTGDGRWIESLKANLEVQGVDPDLIRTEYFFNRPTRPLSGA